MATITKPKVRRRCDDYNCQADHLLHIDGSWPQPFRMVLVGGHQPYLNVYDAAGLIVASLDAPDVRRLVAALESHTPGDER